jgi:hypothetical protein
VKAEREEVKEGEDRRVKAERKEGEARKERRKEGRKEDEDLPRLHLLG